MSVVIAIDGPAGSGKGTIAKEVSKKLDYIYIDTGATYRAIAYAVLENNVSIDDIDSIKKIVDSSNIDIDSSGNIYLDGNNISKEIRTLEVAKIVSPISSYKEVREKLVDIQRMMAKNKNVILEGRDITTVVFPDAKYKFYLDASIDERAKRRYIETKDKNPDISYEEIYENIKNRDFNDMNREIGALKRTDDQVYIDTTNLSIDEVINKVLSYIEGVN